MSSLEDFFESKLEARKKDGLYRELKTTNSLIDFYSNDYLGLARSKELHNNILNKISKFPIQNGSTGSRLLSGNSEYAEHLETKLAAHFRAPSCLIFNSGYNANVAVLSSIPQKGDTIIYDELAHASIKDGARLSMANRFSFKHSDANDLEKKIKHSTGTTFIVVESIYSMDGDECPLKSIIDVAARHKAFTVLDEAHSTGTYGPQGAGLAVEHNLHAQVDLRIHTFGKAAGVHGACVVGFGKLKEYLVNFARPFIYTTSLPLHSLVSIEAAIDILATENSFAAELQKKINHYLKSTSQLANRTSSHSAIQTVIFPGNENVRRASAALFAKGLDVRPIVSPTVQKGKERLRICLHSFNTDEEISFLANALLELSS
jgi:8-amino-7-oxononanoate synthase